jgi:hypothetical protein
MAMSIAALLPMVDNIYVYGVPYSLRGIKPALRWALILSKTTLSRSATHITCSLVLHSSSSLFLRSPHLLPASLATMPQPLHAAPVQFLWVFSLLCVTVTCLLTHNPKANSAQGTAILSTIGISLSDLNVLLGLTCSPIDVVGVGSGNSCDGSTVSCSNGLVVSALYVALLASQLKFSFRAVLASVVCPSLLKHCSTAAQDLVA